MATMGKMAVGMGPKDMIQDVEKFDNLKTPAQDIQISKHAAGGHKPQHEHIRQHAAGHKIHHENVASFCGGGMSKGKKK